MVRFFTDYYPILPHEASFRAKGKTFKLGQQKYQHKNHPKQALIHVAERNVAVKTNQRHAFACTCTIKTFIYYILTLRTNVQNMFFLVALETIVVVSFPKLHTNQ